ncbi:hypothetical protein BKA70DRAFT_205791 [Coprinopsis sp. MPI-PUGE-AT-0042]|nr:hypothetical protein BKA70DRAFT_205791 [Coprinopsis sp. MPI-PUGE-AT-0042]
MSPGSQMCWRMGLGLTNIVLEPRHPIRTSARHLLSLQCPNGWTYVRRRILEHEPGRWIGLGCESRPHSARGVLQLHHLSNLSPSRFDSPSHSPSNHPSRRGLDLRRILLIRDGVLSNHSFGLSDETAQILKGLDVVQERDGKIQDFAIIEPLLSQLKRCGRVEIGRFAVAWIVVDVPWCCCCSQISINVGFFANKRANGMFNWGYLPQCSTSSHDYDGFVLDLEHLRSDACTRRSAHCSWTY